MSMLNIPLFEAMGAKMTYLDRRQGVLAENIANADTPNYRAKELSKVDFGQVLSKVMGTAEEKKGLQMTATQPGHLPLPGVSEQAKAKGAKIVYEAAPNENSVIIEEQMVKANEVQMEYNLITNLMRKNIGMIYTALGRNGA